MIDHARWCEDVVEVSGLDAGGKAEDSRLQRLDVTFEGAVVGIEIAVGVEPVAFFRRLAVEEAFGGDVGDGVVVVDIAIDAAAGVGDYAIAKSCVADAG